MLHCVRQIVTKCVFHLLLGRLKRSPKLWSFFPEHVHSFWEHYFFISQSVMFSLKTNTAHVQICSAPAQLVCTQTHWNVLHVCFRLSSRLPHWKSALRFRLSFSDYCQNPTIPKCCPIVCCMMWYLCIAVWLNKVRVRMISQNLTIKCGYIQRLYNINSVLMHSCVPHFWWKFHHVPLPKQKATILSYGEKINESIFSEGNSSFSGYDSDCFPPGEHTWKNKSPNTSRLNLSSVRWLGQTSERINGTLSFLHN